MKTISLSLPGSDLSDEYTVFFDEDTYGFVYVADGCHSASSSANFVRYDYVYGLPTGVSHRTVPSLFFRSVGCGDVDNLVVISSDSSKITAFHPYVLIYLLLFLILFYLFIASVFRRLSW